MIVRASDLRPGARVRYRPVHTDEWREGELVRASANDEEWLVKSRLGRFWVPVTRLSSAEEPAGE